MAKNQRNKKKNVVEEKSKKEKNSENEKSVNDSNEVEKKQNLSKDKELNSKENRNNEIKDTNNENKKEEGKEQQAQEKEQEESICVERIINVELTEEIKKFLKTFENHRKDIIQWCDDNKKLYSDKINEKTYTFFLKESENIEIYATEKNLNIDLLSVMIYFYNLYCIYNNKEKINFNDLMSNSSITYRGIYEHIDKKSKVFKNLLKEEKTHKKSIEKENNISIGMFSNYKKMVPYSLNLVLAIFLTFLTGYYGSLLLGYTKFTTRLLCGIVFSYLALVLEVLLFIIVYEKTEHIKKKLKTRNMFDGIYRRIHFRQNKIYSKESNTKIKDDLLIKQDIQSTLKKRKNP